VTVMREVHSAWMAACRPRHCQAPRGRCLTWLPQCRRHLPREICLGSRELCRRGTG
jgi:hypothetical protein